jgi:hypothetical protein
LHQKDLLLASSPDIQLAHNNGHRPNQSNMLYHAEIWQGGGLSRMKTFRIRMADIAFATL